MAHRGNFDVVPSRLRSAMSSSLMTTPSVSNGSARVRRTTVSRPTRRQYSATLSMPFSAFQCGSTGSPHLLQGLEQLAVSVRHAVGC